MELRQLKRAYHVQRSAWEGQAAVWSAWIGPLGQEVTPSISGRILSQNSETTIGMGHLPYRIIFLGKTEFH